MVQDFSLMILGEEMNMTDQLKPSQASQGTPGYIFPDFLAKAMAKVDLRTQYEASMLSMTLISIGLVVSVVYFLLYFNFQTWYKVVLVVNGLAGILFMWSFIITTYNQ